MAETFANLVARVSADNTELESGMRQSEQIVKASADNMAGSLATVTSAAFVTTGGVTTMSNAFVIMGAAGTLAGSQLGGMASRVAGVAAAMASLGIAMGPVTIALGVIAAVGAGIWSTMKSDIEKLNPAIEDLGKKLESLRDDLAVLRNPSVGPVVEEEAMRRQARELATDDEGFLRSKDYFEILDQLRERKALEADIASKQADQLAIDKTAAELKTQETAHAATIQNLLDQLAISQGFDPLTLGNMSLDERLLLLKIRQTDEMKAQAALDKTAEESAEARVKALGQQLQIAAGLAKATDFIDDSYERQLAEAMAAINGGVAMPDRTTTTSGFSIGSRPSEQFRFGGARAGGEAIGQQTEQAKQTVILKTIEEKVTVAIEVLKKLPPDVLKTAGINLGTLGYGGGF